MYVAKFHDGERWVTALIKVGTKRLHVLHLDDGGLRVTKVPIEEERYCVKLDLPIDKCARKFRGIARRCGASEAAKEMLNELAVGD